MIFFACSCLFFTSNSAVLLVGAQNIFAAWYPSYATDKIIGRGGDLSIVALCIS